MFTAQADLLPTATYKFQHTESPLDTLVRKRSTRKEDVSQQGQQDIPDSRQQSRHGTSTKHPHVETGTLSQVVHQLHSPLLHGHFARDSYATASSKESLIECFYHDDENVYSDAPSFTNATSYVLHDSMFPQTAEVGTGIDVESSHCVKVDMSQSHSPVPTVIVSSPDADESDHHLHGGRSPIIASGTPNFSRPGRPVIPPSYDEKWRVLERNRKRSRESNPSSIGMAVVKPPFLNNALYYQSPPLSRGGESLTRSSSRSPSPLSTTSFPTPQLAKSGKLESPDSTGNLGLPIAPPVPNAISLPRAPPSRALSPAASLYSSYSYYPFENPISSSASTRTPTPTQCPHPEIQNIQTTPPTYSFPSQRSRTPQEYLQLGIQCHEANKLEDSAVYFEKSAKENGGCGVGMLMWGLSLRHGWGCRKDEKTGFRWLQRAAENAVEDLQSARIGGSLDPQAIRTELVLAIYEVGQCFFQGWGVPKDQRMAVSYYEVAARLGDSDAQNDLAFCLANGRGCKKSRKEAAKWYRAAVAQGQSDVGLAWIYKDKYQ